jgi:hypothetical protein
VCEFLTACGAPKGSKLTYSQEGQKIEVPFGSAEGLALYLNTTELPPAVYRENAGQDLHDEINRLLSHHGRIHGNWKGPTESAFYLYGRSATEMRDRLAQLIATHPLC